MTSNQDEPLLLSAARRRNRARPPVWIMRQAGRYLPEYRALRAQHSFVTLCETPELAVEVSLLPHRLLAVDAVIVFYDILLPLERMGAPLEFTDEGPVFREPIRSLEAVRRLSPLDPKRAGLGILESLARLKAHLGKATPVLGFAGAPFTLAAYLIEGDLGKGGEGIRRALHRDPAMVHALLGTLADATSGYLAAQIDAGADAVQLFDTWAGLLSPADYREFALPYQKRVFETLGDRAPRILYVNGSWHVLEEMGRAGADVVSVDWRGDLATARRVLGEGVALQGNFDPAALFAPPERVRATTLALLESRRGDPAHIVNLGHGVWPDTPVESVRAFVETVQSFR